MLGLILLLAHLAVAAAQECSNDLKGALPKDVTVDDLTLPADAPEGMAQRIFNKYGALIVRGLTASLAPRIREAADAAFERSLGQLAAGKLDKVVNDEGQAAIRLGREWPTLYSDRRTSAELCRSSCLIGDFVTVSRVCERRRRRSPRRFGSAGY